MFRTVVAHTDLTDIPTVLDDLISQAETELGAELPQAAILFSPPHDELDLLLTGLASKWPKLQLIGCTTDGELTSRGGFDEDSVSITLFVSDEITFSTGVGYDLSKDTQAACLEAVSMAGFNPADPAKLCVTLPDSLTASGLLVINSLRTAFNDSVPVVGGVAGDYWRFQSTNQFFGTQVLSDAIPILMMSGPLYVTHGVNSGWEPIGEKALVTKATGNLLQEIDGKPAIAYYQALLGRNIHPTGNCRWRC